MRHSGTGHDSSDANAAISDATADTVGSCFNETSGPIASCNTASHDIDRQMAFVLSDGFNAELAVAVGDIDD